MKLIRASCQCGYATNKSRSGYHFEQWWFPLFSRKQGVLSDITITLPSKESKQIVDQEWELYRNTPRDDQQARRIATAKMRAIRNDVYQTFIDTQMRILENEYHTDQDSCFNPPLKTAFHCPHCSNNTLILDQVKVIAFCKTDCVHQYQWPDSEEQGCPKCGYRPHKFLTESEPQYSNQARTICNCPCSSSLDCHSHLDGYCPKCGSLPDSYSTDNKVFCGIHHEEMLPYRLPASFIFMEPDRPDDKVPNAKFYDDASDDEESIDGRFCLKCEKSYQDWLQSEH